MFKRLKSIMLTFFLLLVIAITSCDGWDRKLITTTGALTSSKHILSFGDNFIESESYKEFVITVDYKGTVQVHKKNLHKTT